MLPQIARGLTTVSSPPLVEHSFNTYIRRLPISISLFQVSVFKVDFLLKYCYFLRVINNATQFNFIAITIGL